MTSARSPGPLRRLAQQVSSVLRISPNARPDQSRMADTGVRGTLLIVNAAALLAYVASALLIAWGTAHLAPTRAVAESFGAISLDNRRILVMEWVAEGITHISIGVLVILVTAVDGSKDATSQLVYVVSAFVLVILAALTAATG